MILEAAKMEGEPVDPETLYAFSKGPHCGTGYRL